MTFGFRWQRMQRRYSPRPHNIVPNCVHRSTLHHINETPASVHVYALMNDFVREASCLNFHFEHLKNPVNGLSSHHQRKCELHVVLRPLTHRPREITANEMPIADASFNAIPSQHTTCFERRAIPQSSRRPFFFLTDIRSNLGNAPPRWSIGRKTFIIRCC